MAFDRGMNIPPRESLFTFLRRDVSIARWELYALRLTSLLMSFVGVLSLVRLLDA